MSCVRTSAYREMPTGRRSRRTSPYLGQPLTQNLDTAKSNTARPLPVLLQEVDMREGRHRSSSVAHLSTRFQNRQSDCCTAQAPSSLGCTPTDERIPVASCCIVFNVRPGYDAKWCVLISDVVVCGCRREVPAPAMIM
eukprot:TRINITY_DN68161_c0_g1_i1.p1 TRINITY_DN68161_c0_g1~~TRINITY_DN68161_c0_g1_i1.p1  ORF type:complete len:138 (-),score=7.01 TRINITY_DN68161_c0_g1_i1:255-668(-)